MRNKSLERADNRKIFDKAAGIVGSSGRDLKLMQSHFEADYKQKKDTAAKRLNLDDRGVNWHQNTIAVYKNGALHLSKENIARIDSKYSGSIIGNAFSKPDMKTQGDKIQIRA